MSLNSNRIATYTYLKTAWTITPIVYGPLDKRGETYLKSASPWIFVDLTSEVRSFQQSLSQRNVKWLTPGVMSIRIFSRESSGEAAMYTLIDSVSALFKGKKVGDAVFKEVVTGKIAPNDSGWLTCTILFVFNLVTTHNMQP